MNEMVQIPGVLELAPLEIVIPVALRLVLPGLAVQTPVDNEHAPLALSETGLAKTI